MVKKISNCDFGFYIISDNNVRILTSLKEK